mgnify:CR=1 FL=1
MKSSPKPKKHIFGLLSTIDNPLLPFWISEARKNEIKNLLLICDSKVRSSEIQERWLERTGGYFNKLNGLKADINHKICSDVPIYSVDNHNSRKTLQLIKKLKITCLFNAWTPRKISKELIDSVPNGIINIHPGILPMQRGCSAVEWAIFNDSAIGNTAHFFDEGYDTGPIIMTESYKFNDSADYQSIRNKVFEKSYILSGKILKKVQEEDLKPSQLKKQNNLEGKYWDPIPNKKMKQVLEKIKKRKYKFQCLK